MNEAIRPTLRLTGVVRRYPRGRRLPRNFARRRRGACGRIRPSLWSRRRAPANRPCCISPGCWSAPTAARSRSRAQPTSGLSDAQRTGLRRNRIGFVYQFHHLLPEFTAAENVMTPQMIAGLSEDRGAPARARPARLSRPRGAGQSPAVGTVGRRAAARRHRPRRRQRPRACCWPTSRPAISTPKPPIAFSGR